AASRERRHPPAARGRRRVRAGPQLPSRRDDTSVSDRVAGDRVRSPSGVRRSGLVAAVALAAVTALLASARAANPAQGTLSPATAMSYRGAAWALTQRDPSAPSVAQGPMRFGAPSLVDPQLLAGEPGLAVGPDGRMYVSAPWGIQSATSLVWRSDDGGRRFVRRDGRLVSSAGDPTGRSCAEAEGGADA